MLCRSTSKGSQPTCPHRRGVSAYSDEMLWMTTQENRAGQIINITFFLVTMSVAMVLPGEERRECAHMCHRGFTSEKNPRSYWLVAGLFPAPFVGGKLWSCREKQLTASTLKKTAEKEACGRFWLKHTGFLHCSYSQSLWCISIQQAHSFLKVSCCESHYWVPEPNIHQTEDTSLLLKWHSCKSTKPPSFWLRGNSSLPYSSFWRSNGHSSITILLLITCELCLNSRPGLEKNYRFPPSVKTCKKFTHGLKKQLKDGYSAAPLWMFSETRSMKNVNFSTWEVKTHLDALNSN